MGAGDRIKNTGHRIQDTGHRTQDTGDKAGTVVSGSQRIRSWLSDYQDIRYVLS